MKIKIILIILAILLIPNILSYSIPVVPLNFTNHTQPNTIFNYTFNFTTNSDCSGILLNHTETITTNPQGVGFININLTSLTQRPNYLCEYRDGALRETHLLPDIIFRDIFLRNVTLDFIGNNTDMYTLEDFLTNPLGINCNSSGVCSGGGVVYLEVPNNGNLNATGLANFGTIIVSNATANEGYVDKRNFTVAHSSAFRIAPYLSWYATTSTQSPFTGIIFTIADERKLNGTGIIPTDSSSNIGTSFSMGRNSNFKGFLSNYLMQGFRLAFSDAGYYGLSNGISKSVNWEYDAGESRFVGAPTFDIGSNDGTYITNMHKTDISSFNPTMTSGNITWKYRGYYAKGTGSTKANYSIGYGFYNDLTGFDEVWGFYNAVDTDNWFGNGTTVIEGNLNNGTNNYTFEDFLNQSTSTFNATYDSLITTNSTYWNTTLVTFNNTQMEDDGGILTILEGWLQSFIDNHITNDYVNVTGDTMTGELKMEHNITMNNNTICFDPSCNSYQYYNGSTLIIKVN